MSNYPNMSYCMFENTSHALAQILDELQECNTIEDLKDDMSQYEKPYVDRLKKQCEQLIEELDRIEQGQEPWIGHQ